MGKNEEKLNNEDRLKYIVAVTFCGLALLGIMAKVLFL